MKKLIYSLVIIIIVFAGCSPSALKYLSKGQEKYGFQDYRGAISDLTRALQINPGLAEAWFYRGNAKRACNQSCVGITYRSKLDIDVDLKDTIGSQNKEKTYQSVNGTIVTYADAVRNDPRDNVSHHKSVTPKAGIRFWHGEIADYSKAIEINPGYADAYYSRALANIRFGQTDSACLDFKRAGELGRTDAIEQISIYCR